MKKNIITAIIAAGLVCASLASCTNNTTTNNQIVDRQPLTSTITAQPEKAHFTFMEHSQDTPHSLKSDDLIYASATSERVSFVAENRADRPAAKKINEVLTNAYNRSKDIYQNLVDSLEAYLAQENRDLSVFPWETTVDYTCLRNDGKAISVLETIDSYEAGTLIGTTCYAYNFDPPTGDHVTNIFYTLGDKESFDTADDVMYKKLLAKYGEEIISYDNVTASFVDVARQCWYFTESGIKIIFNTGSIAKPDAGILELEYSKEELPELAQKYFN